MNLQALAIARNAFVESLRQPIFLLLILISGILQVFNTWSTGYSMGYTDSGEVSGDNKLLLDIGLSTVFVFGTLLAAFIATSVFSREIENKTVLTVVSKPVSRPTLVIGKYLGVAGAILVATTTMLIFLMMAIRHGVMSTAADELDGPVLVFSVGMVAGALALSAWCNYFYGWNFPQTSVTLMLPLLIVGYACVLLIGKEWQPQSPAKDFKPQIMLGALCMIMAVLVLTSVAITASTRLKQVATIGVCAAVFLGSLLTNYFFGRHVYSNEAVGIIRTATPAALETDRFSAPGDLYSIELQLDPRLPVAVGSSFYYGASPNGAAMAVDPFEPLAGDPTDGSVYVSPDTPFAIAVTESKGRELKVRVAGNGLGKISRPPMPEDYVFLQPTTVNYKALVPWALLPNMQYFWTIDAISQNQPLPAMHVLLVALYGLGLITAFLSLGVILFQRRDVG
jgi:ABC-2 type transport system permease protein